MSIDQTERPTTGTPDRRPLLLVLAVLGVALALALAFFLFLGNVLGDDDEVATNVIEGKLTEEAYAAVDLGTPEEAVLQALLPVRPRETRVVERFEGREPETPSASCVYYDRQDGRLGQQYRFCFVDDLLVDKTVVLPDEVGAEVVD